jgi:hypothetical protein
MWPRNSGALVMSSMADNANVSVEIVTAALSFKTQFTCYRFHGNATKQETGLEKRSRGELCGVAHPGKRNSQAIMFGLINERINSALERNLP